MCGIVGVVGSNTAVADVVAGLKRLEYRGYDSAGVASPTLDGIELRRSVGKIINLEYEMAKKPIENNLNVAIGHTRWATHGTPVVQNAHPHMVDNNVAVVHNGIIENYQHLREELGEAGVQFLSDTDTETIPQMINKFMAEGETEHLIALRKATTKAEGAFALAVTFKGVDDKIVATRRDAPLVIGLSEGKNYVGSDPIALAQFTNKFIFLENDHIAEITSNEVIIFSENGDIVEPEIKELDVDAAVEGKGEYPHYMLKEIYEQPDVISKTLTKYLNKDLTDIRLPDMPFDMAEVPQITIVACGTSWHAGLVAKYWLENYTRVPVNVDIASEFRYRNPPLIKGGLTILISQSGETADSLAALKHVKDSGQYVLSIVNVPDSSIDRESDVSLYTQAGPEIGVASTKAFTTQLTMLAMLTLKLAVDKGLMDEETKQELLSSLKELPNRMNIIESLDKKMRIIAEAMVPASSSLYLGRDAMFPIALEGALKIKEISYIHAEGLAAGEMKHGPIALIEEGVPIVMLAPYDRMFEKTVSNMKEVEARKGAVILFTDEKGAKEAGENEQRIVSLMPDVHPFVAPIMYSLPMQLLAYHTADLKGTDVDQPRNLAKSVTVE